MWKATAISLPQGFGGGGVVHASVDIATEPPELAGSTYTVSDHLAYTFRKLGVETAFGLVGGIVAPLYISLDRAGMQVIHCRHEAGAAFAAIEAYFANGRPCIVFCTAGPGLANAITGIAAARRDGAKLIVLSGVTAAEQRGRWAFQETSLYTAPTSDLFTAGQLFHYAAVVEHSVELHRATREVAAGLQQPGGFVAHLALPPTLQVSNDFQPFIAGGARSLPLECAEATAQQCARILTGRPFVIWVGFGARHAASEVIELARRTGAPVMCSPRGKGIFPEDDGQFLGVTGFGGHERVFRYMADHRPEYVLVLGTRLGEFTSFWSEEMAPSKKFIHVDIDPQVPGAAYPRAATVGVQAEIGSFLKALIKYMPPRRMGTCHLRLEAGGRKPIESPAQTPVRPPFLMRAIQQVIVDKAGAPVITEAGNAFAWGTHSLRFSSPELYRVSTGFGSMGHAVAGVVGMALARNGKAVALAGDGAMLMNSEVSTAVQYNVPAIWIVLNDSLYGMVHQGMSALGMRPVATSIPKTNFAMIAEGMGARGIRVEREDQVIAALEAALEEPGPCVIDVIIDPDIKAPTGRRSESLAKQGILNPNSRRNHA